MHHDPATGTGQCSMTVLSDISSFNGIDTSKGESSMNAAAGYRSHELPQNTNVFKCYQNNLISNGSSLCSSTDKDRKGKKRQILNKVEDRRQDVSHLVETATDKEPQNVDMLADHLLKSHPPPPYSEEAKIRHLTCPVIIPQRRPRDWTRGFMRAYAPVLADCGISQKAFLDFLKAFHSIHRDMPMLLGISAILWHFMPFGHFAIIPSLATESAIEICAQIRTKLFLRRMNREFFMPRGVYCLLMTYDPKFDTQITSEDIIRFVKTSMEFSRVPILLHRLDDNKSHSIDLPESASLVFPAWELGDPLFNPFKYARRLLENWIDRKAQARYAKKNPPKALAAMAPAEHTVPESWLTVEAVDPHPADTRNDVLISDGQKKTARKPGTGTGKMLFKENVMYLMIVNLPTKAELSAMNE